MEISQILSWIGTVTGTFTSIPQLVKTLRTKKVEGISATTFLLIVVTCACQLVRAININEASYVFYYSMLVVINSAQLFLIWKYNHNNQKRSL